MRGNTAAVEEEVESPDMIEQNLSWGEGQNGSQSSREKPLTQKMTSGKKEEAAKPRKEEVSRATGTHYRVPLPASARVDESRINDVAVARLKKERKERQSLESPEKKGTWYENDLQREAWTTVKTLGTENLQLHQ